MPGASRKAGANDERSRCRVSAPAADSAKGNKPEPETLSPSRIIEHLKWAYSCRDAITFLQIGDGYEALGADAVICAEAMGEPLDDCTYDGKAWQRYRVATDRIDGVAERLAERFKKRIVIAPRFVSETGESEELEWGMSRNVKPPETDESRAEKLAVQIRELPQPLGEVCSYLLAIDHRLIEPAAKLMLGWLRICRKADTPGGIIGAADLLLRTAAAKKMWFGHRNGRRPKPSAASIVRSIKWRNAGRETASGARGLAAAR
jgi:hypothetical protein